MPEDNGTFQGDISSDGMKCFYGNLSPGNLSAELAFFSDTLLPLAF